MRNERVLDKGVRPFITLNIAESVDGKIAPIGGGKVNFGGTEDRQQMEILRSEADGVVIGCGTLLTEDPPLLIRDKTIQARRTQHKGAPHPKNIAICSSLPPQLEQMLFFRNLETEKIVFTTEKTPIQIRETAARYARVEIVSVNDNGRVNLCEVVTRLRQIGIEKLLLEGGGELNFSMLQAGLVDEIYLTVCPFIFGGRTAPSSVGGEGFPFDEVCKLQLVSHRVGINGRIFLHYNVLDEPPIVSPSPIFPAGLDLN